MDWHADGDARQTQQARPMDHARAMAGRHGHGGRAGERERQQQAATKEGHR
jgi:hypothetical protein